MSSKEAVNAGKVAFWPVGFNLFSYQKILGEGEFLGSFLISIVVLGTAVSMVCVLMAALEVPLKEIFMYFYVIDGMADRGGGLVWEQD